MSSAQTTTDHDVIRRWAEARKGRPSLIRTGETGGILRLDFGDKEDALEEIGWEEFFAIFDRSGLAFLHQDKTDDGQLSRFNKFIERE